VIDNAPAGCGNVDLVGCHPNMVAEQMRASLSDDRLNNNGRVSAPVPVVPIPPASSQRQPCWPGWR
jgi:hypothetical protein